jgi:hypothetical protein
VLKRQYEPLFGINHFPGHSSVYNKLLTGCETGLIREEKSGQSGNIFNLADPAD